MISTLTTLVHPRREMAATGVHPHRCTVWRVGRDGARGLTDNIPAAYAPAGGRDGGPWQGEHDGYDKIRLNGWYPDILPPAECTLCLADGSLRRFDVVDALPGGPGPDATLLIVKAK